MIIPHLQLQDLVKNRLKHNPAVALLGPRQCGKTILARMLSSGIPGDYFDLENPADVARLSAPMTVLESLSGLVVIDEVQRLPEVGVKHFRRLWNRGASSQTPRAR